MYVQNFLAKEYVWTCLIDRRFAVFWNIVLSALRDAIVSISLRAWMHHAKTNEQYQHRMRFYPGARFAQRGPLWSNLSTQRLETRREQFVGSTKKTASIKVWQWSMAKQGSCTTDEFLEPVAEIDPPFEQEGFERVLRYDVCMFTFSLPLGNTNSCLFYSRVWTRIDPCNCSEFSLKTPDPLMLVFCAQHQKRRAYFEDESEEERRRKCAWRYS